MLNSPNALSISEKTLHIHFTTDTNVCAAIFPLPCFVVTRYIGGKDCHTRKSHIKKGTLLSTGRNPLFYTNILRAQPSTAPDHLVILELNFVQKTNA